MGIMMLGRPSRLYRFEARRNALNPTGKALYCISSPPSAPGRHCIFQALPIGTRHWPPSLSVGGALVQRPQFNPLTVNHDRLSGTTSGSGIVVRIVLVSLLEGAQEE